MFVNVMNREIKKMDLIPRHPGDEIWPDGAEPRERERRSESVFDLERLLGAGAAKTTHETWNWERWPGEGRRQVARNLFPKQRKHGRHLEVNELSGRTITFSTKN